MPGPEMTDAVTTSIFAAITDVVSVAIVSRPRIRQLNYFLANVNHQRIASETD